MKLYFCVFTAFIKINVFASDHCKLAEKNQGLICANQEYISTQTKTYLSQEKMFGVNILIDELWHEQKGVTCQSILFIEPDKFILKKDSFDYLLKVFSITEILSNFVFVATHYSKPRVFYSFQIDIFRKTNKTSNRIKLRTAAQIAQALTPNKNSLFHLLHSVITGANFLHKNNFIVNSLTFNSILHLGTRKDFLITDYSHKRQAESTKTFASIFNDFLNEFLDIHRGYLYRLNQEELRLSKEIYICQKNIIDLQKIIVFSDDINLKQKMQNLEKTKQQKQQQIVQTQEEFSKQTQHQLIFLVSTELLTMTDNPDLTPTQVFEFYQKNLITHL
jgi:hypothetical protein